MATCGSGRSWRWRREMDSNGCLQLHFVKENVCHTSGNITKRKMKCTSSSDASQQRVANSNSCYGSNPTALFIFVLAGSQLAVSASSDSNVASAGNVLPTLSQQQQQPELPRPTEATPPAVDRVRRRPAHETVSGPPAATPPSAALMIINGSRGGTQSYNTHRVQQPSEVIQNLLHYYNGQQPPLKGMKSFMSNQVWQFTFSSCRLLKWGAMKITDKVRIKMAAQNDHYRPTEVKLGVYINTIYSISEQTMDYSVSMYLRQAWRDPRLAFPMMQSKFRQIRLGDDHLAHVWVPDTFFRNEKRATFHDVTVSNRLMRLNATGHIWYVTKISATLSCPMKLNKYPMDTQKCPMMFESFGNTMDILYFSWIDRPVDIERDLQLPQFSLRGYTQHDCSQNYTAGAFPCMEIGFILRRDIGYFLIQQYVPSLLIVILSWVSFWINVDASPARVSIGLLTVLTTTTQSTAGVNSSLPRVSYIKAIDVWMSTCLLFVFAALVEYALVNVLARRHSVRHSVGGGGGAGLMTSFRRQVPGRFPINKSTPAPSSSAAAAVVAAAGPSSRQQRPCLLPGISSLLPDNSGTNQTRFDQQQQQVNRPNSTTVTSDQAATTRPVGSYGNMSRVAMTTGGGPVRSGTCYETCPAAAAYDGKWKARRVDRISRKAFPLAFLLFMLAYWIGYSLPSSADVDDEGEIPISTSD